MAETPQFPEVPAAIPAPQNRWRPSLVWLVPLIAVLIGGWLAVRAVLERGPTISILFKTAEGLEPGKTRIKYKAVDVGVVKRVTLADDRAGVVVTAELAKQAQELLVEDTRFWVVRARISGGTVSGIGTLLSGSYIGMDAGTSQESRREFVGLETPPVITSDLPGKQYILKGDDIGSLDIGTPVYYRRLQAGQVVAYELDQQGKGVIIKIFVNAPYDRYVGANTRFWHSSGIDVALDASGLKFNTESLASVLLGGVAFQAPDDSAQLPPVAADSVFNLFGSRTQAMKQPDTIIESYVLVFRESVRGLSIGAPVDFRGVVVGEVKSINIDFNPAVNQFEIPVEIDFYPERLRRRYPGTTTRPIAGGPLLQRLVARGFRAQLRTANLLTGQLYVAFDFFPKAGKAQMDLSQQPPHLPTMPGSLQELQTALANIAGKLEKVPFEELSTDLRQTLQNTNKLAQRLETETAPELKQTLQSANKLLQRLDAEIAPELKGTLGDARRALSAVEGTLAADAPLQQDARETMREIARAARAFRALSDYLERHPEALIRGKREDVQK